MVPTGGMRRRSDDKRLPPPRRGRRGGGEVPATGVKRQVTGELEKKIMLECEVFYDEGFGE